MNDCNLIAAKFAETKSGTALKKKLSNDYGKFVAIASLVYDSNSESGYTSKFEAYLNRYENLTPKEEAKVMLDYYNSEHFDVNYQSVDKEFDKQVTAYGYVNTNAKIFSIRFAANKFLSFYQSDLIKGKLDEHKEDRLNYYADRCINMTRKVLAGMICEVRGLEVTKANKDAIFEELKPMDGRHLNKIARELSESDDSIRNTFALYREMSTDKINFFNRVINTDSRLGELRFDSKSTLDEDINYDSGLEEIVNGEVNDEDADDLTKEYDIDGTTARWDDNSGMSSNFMKSYDLDVKSILATIPKVISIEQDSKSKPQYDRSNPFGSIDFIDSKLVSTSLISGVDRTNLDSFIQSIKDIANKNSELRGLHILAEMLDKNRDIAIKFRRDFVKTIMPKTETRIDVEGNVAPIQSNKKSNRIQTIRFDFQNDIKHTTFTVETSGVSSVLNEVDTLIEKYNRLTRKNKDSLVAQATYNNIVEKLTTQLKYYYPSMDKTAIENYIRVNKINNQTSVVDNMRVIKLILEDTVKGAIESQKNKEQNDIVEEDNKKNQTNNPLPFDDVISSKAINQTIYLANAIASYSTTRLEFNSKNAVGNQSSDIINSSLITELMNVLNSSNYEGKINKDLQNWADYKFQGNQYNLSNILVEKRDTKNNIINYGLFRNENGRYIPTTYASQLISISLFNGAGNPNTEENVLYSGMSQGDYVYTAFANYFNCEKDYSGAEEKLPFAQYFMRIPSDAPKNFIVRSARYNYNDSKYGKLLIVENSSEVSNEVNKELDKLSKVENNYSKEQLSQFTDISSKKDYNRMISDLQSNRIRNRRVYPNNILEGYNVKEGDIVSAGYLYKDEAGNETRYVIRGKLKSDSYGRTYIDNATASIVGDINSINIAYSIKSTILRKAYKEGNINGVEIKRKLNTNHPLYTQYRNVFVQELTDMANVINTWFQTDDEGKIILWTENEVKPEGVKTGDPKFKEGWGLDEESARKAYAIYHVGKGHKHFIEKDSTGAWHFTGRLFTDDKFSVTDPDGTIHNYGQEVIDETINFFYGGANDSFIHYTTDNLGHITVNLTDTQEVKLNEKLNEFINHYLNQQVERFEQFRNLDIAGLMNSDENIYDFALNYRLAYYNFNDIFEGDAKFYKDTQTFLKRAKESQASGVPYGFADYSQDYREDSKLVEGAYLNNPDVQKYLTDLGLNVKQMTKFNGVTIKNTVATSEECKIDTEDTTNKLTNKDGSLVHDLVKNAHLDVSFARKLMSGFSGTTINDAQSYITFEEWIRRVAGRGQLRDHLPLIKKIMNGERLSAKELDNFVQVQKNFYYDMYFDKNTNTFAPRQIKNAEFVLVPQFIKGTQLEQVYNMMKENGIDQLNTEETSKAGKARVLSLFDEETGELTQKNIDDFNAHAKDYIEEYDYNHLYTQQETPQHLDAENKAGIQILKKMIDNIVDGTPLAATRDDFFNNYEANIYESFEDICREINIPLDKNGNIKLDSDGNISGLNYQVFFNKLREECMRLGLDSNMIDYVTLVKNQAINNITKRPNAEMPAILSNTMNKLESIAQSVFNRGITRQTLPGFHAAQITNVGFKKIAGKEEVSYSKQLRYHPITEDHPEGERYIEIMLPKANFNFAKDENGNYIHSDEELLKQLKEAKLDEIIGYRIPTEGKQSVCIMKVVGFIDDGCGSTIVVPNDWVSQTGSDFDIDSVYGIQYESRLDRNKHIQKIDYVENPDVFDYFDYVNRGVEKTERLPKGAKKQFEEALNYIKEADDKSRAELSKEEQEAYDALSDESKQLVKDANIAFNQTVTRQENGKLTREDYIKQIKFVADYIRTNKSTLDEADENFLEVHDAMSDSIENYGKYMRQMKSNAIKEVQQKRLDDFEARAKKLGLMSYKEFINADVSKINSRRARNNRILDDFKKILKDDSSLEENLSRSNFDDIIEARNKLIAKSPIKTVRDNRSLYDFMDQAAYQEDVMSGAKLKAFSVTRDTFNSVCNNVKPTISKEYAVNVVYNYDNENDLETYRKRFGTDNVEDLGNHRVRITHTTIGYTYDNKNITGKILTAYSSQTTANILDAVKEGAIPNVNDFTFAVYKTLPDIGIDYDTAIAFIMQPAIRRIVDAYNANKSIYSEDSNKPIEEAIKSVAIDMGLDVTQEDSLGSVLEKVNTQFDTNFDVNKNPLWLDYSQLYNRINKTTKGYSSPVEGLFDMRVLLAYNHINKLAQHIGSLARVCNPDRFGAKQTLFQTNKVFDDINDLIQTDRGKHPILLKDDMSMLESIYPGIVSINKVTGIPYVDIDNFIKSDINTSSYKSLAAFLKYSTATSTKINSMLFETETDWFKNIVFSLESKFSFDRHITEKEYKDFKQYILNATYNDTDFMKLPTTMDLIDGQWRQVVDTNTTEADERIRIFGYNRNQNIPFRCENIAEPTKEEVDKFSKLSPAQKVAWLQLNSVDSGIFGCLKVNLYNAYEARTKGQSKQSILFNDDATDVETAFMLYNKAFNSTNPLVKMAAVDLIKYSFLVEGFKMRRNAVNKIITNRALKDSTSFVKADGSFDSLVNQIKDSFNSYAGNFDIAENYVRSHSSANFIKHKTVSKVRKGKLLVDELTRKGRGLIYIDLTNPEAYEDEKYTLTEALTNSELIQNQYNNVKNKIKELDKSIEKANNDRKLAIKYGLINDASTKDDSWLFTENAYVELTFNSKDEDGNKKVNQHLYKITRQGDRIFAYPINKLEENESAEFSTTKDNNKFAPRAFYEAYISRINDIESESIKFLTPEELNDMAADYRSDIHIKKVANRFTFDINRPGKYEEGGTEDAINKIGKTYLALDRTPKPFNIQNRYLYNKVNYKFGNKQSITYIDAEGNEVSEEFIFRRQTTNEINRMKADGITPKPNTVVCKRAVKTKKIDINNVNKPSKIIDFELEAVANIRKQKEQGDRDAGKQVNRIENKGIKETIDDYERYQDEIYDVIHQYVKTKSQYLNDRINQFVKDEDGHYLSIDDTKVIDIIRNNDIARNDFLKVILETRALTDKYSDILGFNLDEVENKNVKESIKNIQDIIRELSVNGVIARAENRFGNDFLAKLSDDPTLQNNIVSIFDGFHSTSWFDAWIGDLQDSGNKLVQIVTKNVMADIRAKDMQAERLLSDYDNRIADIYARARAEGLNIDQDKIFGKDGNFINSYNDKLKPVIKELFLNYNEARKNIQNDPETYIKAKRVYDKFKIDHINQPFVKEYYQELYDAETPIVENHIEIYSEWVKLNDKIKYINARRSNGALTPEFEEELTEVRNQIDNLRSVFDYSTMEPKPTYDYGIPGTKWIDAGMTDYKVVNPEVYRKARLNNYADAVALDKFLTSRNEIRSKYISHTTKVGFEDKLDKCLAIINSAEKRDNYGRITTSTYQLENNDEYKAAKEWLRNNASFVIDDEIKEELNEAYKVLGFKASNNRTKVVIKKHENKGENVRDEFGRIDGRIFTEEEQDAVKKDLESKLKINTKEPYSERVLISNGPEVNEIYPTVVYKYLQANGIPNKEYLAIVENINNILCKHYSSSTKRVETSKMTEDELDALYNAYQPLFLGVKKTVESTNGKTVAWFIRKYVDTDYYNHTAFEAERALAESKGENYYRKWQRVNLMKTPKVTKSGEVITDSLGNIVYDESIPLKPNRYLYGALKVNMEEYLKKKSKSAKEKLIKEMEDKTKALATINDRLETVETPYYDETFRAMKAKGEKEFNEWYERNHVYNPYTHKMQPTGIWQTTRVRHELDNGSWQPKFAQLESEPKKEYKNKYFVSGTDSANNYRTKEQDDELGYEHDSTYDNIVETNKYEDELKAYLKEMCMNLASTSQAKHYFNTGKFVQSITEPEHDKQWWLKQVKETVGYSDYGKTSRDEWYDDMSYSEDITPGMPMLIDRLRNKRSYEIEKELEDSRPRKAAYEGDEEAYEKAKEAWYKRKEVAEKELNDIHNSLVNRDFNEVMRSFIKAACHYNAVQDNKYILHYTRNMLARTKVYKTTLGFNNLTKINKDKDNPRYAQTRDDKLVEQFENWMRRVLYNQYKQNNGNYTKFANIIQSLTSSKFMMLNITGGIGNITVGETAIIGEAIAKEFFNKNDYLKGKEMWMAGVASFIAGRGKDTSTTLADAIRKFMDVVDFDAMNYAPEGSVEAKAFKNFRDFMYSPNSMGEDLMQNGAMFSMMYANRLIEVPDAENKGRLKYKAMTLQEYINKCHEEALKNIIQGTDLEAKFTSFLNDIKHDDNKLKDYIWGRRDFTTEFANIYLNNAEKRKFIAERKKLRETATTEFESHKTIMEQLELKNGKLAFKEGSILDQLDKDSIAEGKKVSDALRFMAEFKGKVISVNKEIHGNYDKLSAAQIEKNWWGSLVMQYHKHIYPGILKHWRRKGYYNEERGFNVIGCGPALYDFLTLPIRKHKAIARMPEAQRETIEATQNLLKDYVDLALNAKLNFNLMNDNQQAAILRGMQDACGALAAILTAIAIRVAWDDDKLKDSWFANLALYSADSLASQSMMYNPVFLPGEFKKLWSSPIASLTMPSDILDACNIIAEGLMTDDYEWDYTTGRYRGQNKLAVKLTRQIPIYRSYSNLTGLNQSNSYYKLGDNMLSIINVKGIADAFKGE